MGRGGGVLNKRRLLETIIVSIIIFIALCLIWSLSGLSFVEIIQCYAALGTVSAAIAAMNSTYLAKRSFSEQKTSNLRALKPLIITRSKEINITFDPKIQPFLLDWDSGTTLSNINGSFIELANISHGVAKDVVIKMELKNCQKFIDNDFKDIDPFKFLRIKKGKHIIKKDVDCIIIDSDLIYKGYGLRANNCMYPIEKLPDQHIIAIEGSDKSQTNKIKIPDAFLVMFNLIFYLNGLGLNVKDYPTLQVTIQCQDLIGNDYEYVYQYYVESVNVKTSVKENKKVHCLFNVKQI